MINFFAKKLNKKGFTLAELLVVVAILIAIAVPVFTGMLADAEENVKNANIRAVRAAGVTEILTNWDEHGATGGTANTAWTATAKVSPSGDMTDLQVTDGNAAADEVAGSRSTGYTVTVGIHQADVTSATP